MTWGTSGGGAINNWELYQFYSFRDANNSNEYTPTSDYTDKGIELLQYNQHLFEDYEAEINNFMYHTSDPGGVFDGSGASTPTAASAFHLLMIMPFDSNGDEMPKGHLARITIQDVIALGMSRYMAWTVVPQMVVRPAESTYTKNDKYDPNEPFSGTNRPYIWNYAGDGEEGGLWVGSSHVVTDIIPDAVLLDPTEDPYVEASIDGDYGTTYMEFGIPGGPSGPTGETGVTGWGEKGDTPTLEVGVVTTTESDGDVQINVESLDPLAYSLDFILPKGKDGVDGVTGIKGDTGTQGDTGSRGVSGSISTFFFSESGADGEPGETGETGLTGPEGPMGLTGSDGFEIEGPPGPPGETGETGLTGPPSTVEGPPGPKGDTGIPGAKGETGKTGNPGVSNIPGPRGHTGDSIVGPRGPTGPTGKTGNPGPKGDTSTTPGPASTVPGPKGDTGDTGQSITGPPGPASTVAGPAGNTPEYYYNSVNSTLYILNV